MAKTAAELFNQKVPEVLKGQPEKFKGLNEIFKFVITGDEGGTWTLDLKQEPPTCEAGETKKPTCTIEIGLTDFQALLGNMMLALQFMSQKKMKIDNPMAAMKLQKILPLLK
jgi:hypothetical protein